jgi:hypothetical protein
MKIKNFHKSGSLEFWKFGGLGERCALWSANGVAEVGGGL